MAKQPQIIVVDDEVDLCETISDYLTLQGYHVRQAHNGEELRALCETGAPDLVLLDIHMPGEDGLSLARFLREHTDCGIIMLTGAGELVDRIVGLEAGADDYMPKPVDLRELLARAKAVLRRVMAVQNNSAAAGAGTAGKSGGKAQNLISFGACKLDLAGHRMTNAEGEEIALTAMEFSLLKVFAEHADEVLDRDKIAELAHEQEWDPFDRSIDIRISRLRKKIEKNPANPQIIKTVRGIGYRFSPKG